MTTGLGKTVCQSRDCSGARARRPDCWQGVIRVWRFGISTACAALTLLFASLAVLITFWALFPVCTQCRHHRLGTAASISASDRLAGETGWSTLYINELQVRRSPACRGVRVARVHCGIRSFSVMLLSVTCCVVFCIFVVQNSVWGSMTHSGNHVVVLCTPAINHTVVAKLLARSRRVSAETSRRVDLLLVATHWIIIDTPAAVETRSGNPPTGGGAVCGGHGKYAMRGSYSEYLLNYRLFFFAVFSPPFHWM